jgi:hypothetical protein
VTKAWDFLKALGRQVFQFALRYPVAIVLTVLLVAGAVLMACFGKTFQVGGLIGKLWGKKPSDTDVRVLPPSDRVDKDGKLIPLGEPDEKGFVQAPITTNIKDPGIFSDPDTVTVVHPEKGEVTLPLPKGVKNSDVKQVIEVRPNVYEVRNNDKGSDPKEVLDILDKK